jgi:hypothetical protein
LAWGSASCAGPAVYPIAQGFSVRRRTCGSQLAGECAGSGKWMAQAGRLREQAHSYKGFALAWGSASCAGLVVYPMTQGFSVMRRACGSQLAGECAGSGKWMAQADRLREQAHSHKGFALAWGSASCAGPAVYPIAQGFSVTRRTCGSQPRYLIPIYGTINHILRYQNMSSKVGLLRTS